MNNATWALQYPEKSRELFEEVDRLMGFERISTHYKCFDLWALYAQKYWNTGKDDPKWYTACALAFIWKVGYITAKREERAKRKKK